MYAKQFGFVVAALLLFSSAAKAQEVTLEGHLPESDLVPNSIEYVLAASWQPAFCTTPRGRDELECRSQTPDRFDATHFSVHGLWPDDLDDKAIFPCYCDRGPPVGCGDDQPPDPDIDLSAAFLDELAIVMPGVDSDLHLHEWPKHGSCYEDDKSGPDAGSVPAEYFSETMALMSQLNASPVRRLFAASLDDVLTRQQIEAAFDMAFGEGAGERVVIRCWKVGGEDAITEIWINLKGDVSKSSFADLMQAAPTRGTSSSQTSCDGGRVVKVVEE